MLSARTLVLACLALGLASAACPFGFDAAAPHAALAARRRLLDTVAAASLPAARAGAPSPSPSPSLAAAPAPAAAAAAPVTGEEGDEEGGPPVNGQRAINTDVGSSPLAAAVLGSVGGISINSSVFYTPLAPAALAAAKPPAWEPRQRGWTAPAMSKPSSCSKDEYKAIARMFNDTDLGLEHPAALRLAFHTCGTYTSLGHSGGCDGAWLRSGPDAAAVPNTGLAEHVAVLEKVKDKYPCITYADLYTFAGSVAAELAGGPAIAWQPGRVDALGPGPSSPAFSSRLPEANINGAALGYFTTQLGLAPREMVALVGGGHSIGSASTQNSGWHLVWAAGDGWPTPPNRYFADLVERSWVQAEAPETGLPQWVLADDEPLAGAAGAVEGKPIGRLPSDMAMLYAKPFEPFVREYARDAARFLSDFALVTQKLLALGSNGVGGAGHTFKWKGLKGDWEGWGADAAWRRLEDGPSSAVSA